MIFSMTGFAAVQRETSGGTLALELRSVNHRYLELHLRLDDTMRVFEPQLREGIAAKLGRGKVECRANLLTSTGKSVPAELSAASLEQLAQLSTTVQKYFPQSQPLTVADILRWPGVLATDDISSEALAADFAAALEQALDELAASRAREGEKLAAVILDRVAQMEALVAKTRPLLPALLRAYQEKLEARIREVLETADDARIHQELALYAQKIDVDEELERLTAHLKEVRRVVGGGGAIGKRLDFLMQELNREANTLGSKSVSSETSQASMELKVLIEQIREQVQNIE
ncbi:uncharacterized protein NMK_1521 [Novimethylophilus kurashikiensis]|uniref:YicC family protein n=1 Tax=Novimethylophilus kurashikiensis TaxID=1825523 RepID=A0A2R5F8V0_9PROT|nr:YicC/YloC family endoribonuclease [Novimethylophilus kurashikiensis]GBG13968.1 uncharacterized protein NMK_1521 [Novimethylophilus kurashikiensis]